MDIYDKGYTKLKHCQKGAALCEYIGYSVSNGSDTAVLKFECKACHKEVTRRIPLHMVFSGDVTLRERLAYLSE